MKSTNGLTVVGATLLLAAANSRAQSADKLYLEVNAGPAFQQNTAIRNGSSFGSGGDVKYDTGLRAGVVVGYNWTRSLAAELDAGVIWNTINTIGANNLSTVGASAQVQEIPLLVNGIYKVPLKGALKPYIGAGAGAMVGLFDSANVPLSYSLGGDPHYRSTDVTFAYQFTAGFKYKVGKNMDLGIAYKFIGTTDHSWSDNNITFKTDGTMAHNIVATFTWRF